MNYEKIYNQIIDRAKGRVLEGYKERHHILPKCMGGSNSKENLVDLTAREHYLCHWLLTKIYTKNRKLAYAFWFMSHQLNNKNQERGYKVSSRTYQESVQNLKMTEEHKEKIRATRIGKKTIVHPETKEMKYVLREDLQSWLAKGWENTNYKKGTKITVSEEGRRSLAEARKRDQIGKVGLQAKASKGPYTVEFETGEKFTAGSYPELSKLTGISYSTIQCRITKEFTDLKKGWRAYKGS